MIDDTALPKQGVLPVGVARQYCGQLGKRANCQALVSLTLARDEAPIPLALRLFLPEAWTDDPRRCARAGVPEPAVVARSKGEIALAEVDRVLAAGGRFGVVLADAGYGASAAFCHGLDARGQRWAVGIPRNQTVYGTAVRLGPPVGRRVRPTRTWPGDPGGALPGGRGPRVRPPPGLPRSAAVWATARASATTGTCRAKRLGWWASGAPAASASTTSATCRRGPRCRYAIG